LKLEPNILSAFVITSRIRWWVSHFDFVMQRGLRCPGEDICPRCQRGYQRQMRYVAGILVGGRDRYLFEFRARHLPILDLLDESPTGGVGAKLHAWKAGTASNSPIEVELKGWSECPEWDISRLVDSLGLAVSSGGDCDASSIGALGQGSEVPT
jgi:hypothetical protein